MTSDKFILEINWKATKLTALMAVLSIVVCAYVPVYIHDTYTIATPLFVVLQLVTTAMIVVFFFGGISKTEKLKVALSLLSCTAIFGIVSNITNQTFLSIGNTSLLMDVVALGLINICGTLTTLTFTRIQKKSVNRDSQDVQKKLTGFETLANSTNPIIVASIVFVAFAMLGTHPPSFMIDRSFAVTVPFFIWVQLGTTYILTNNFFSDAKGNKKSRIYFSILSLALLIGAISNLEHDQVVPRIGNRIDINTITFLIMNTGGLFTTLGYHFWNDYTKELKDKVQLVETKKASS